MRAVHFLALWGVFLPGCFGGCSSLREEEKTQCLDTKAPQGGFALELGTTEGGKAWSSLSGKTLKLDYGPQGGHHFYYSLKLYGAVHATEFVARFYPSAYSGARDGEGGSGGASSSSTGGLAVSSAQATGTSTGSGTTGSGTSTGQSGGQSQHCEEGGSTDCYEADTWFYGELYPAPTCDASQWVEIDNQRFIVQGRGPVTGTLHIAMGTCAKGGCPVNAAGDYELAVTQATADVPISYVP